MASGVWLLLLFLLDSEDCVKYSQLNIFVALPGLWIHNVGGKMKVP